LSLIIFFFDFNLFLSTYFIHVLNFYLFLVIIIILPEDKFCEFIDKPATFETVVESDASGEEVEFPKNNIIRPMCV
jgi:hypothetical protein